MTFLGPPMDLDDSTAAALEIDTVLESVARMAASPPAARALREGRPGTDAVAISRVLDAVEEIREMVRDGGRFLPRRLPDPIPALEALAVEGYGADPLALRDLASILLAASELASRGKERSTPFGSMLREIPDLRELARPILDHVLPDGTLADGASTELGRVRNAITRTGERLRRRLEAFVHDPSSGAMVRDDFVTQRNGRYVIPIRSDAPKQLRGIVHGASSSGATLFVEPLDCVEANNDLVRLADKESAESERIVLSWSERFRAEFLRVEAAVDALVQVDVLQARALWAEQERGVRPSLDRGSTLLLDGLRHPLLDGRLRESGLGGCIPIRLAMERDARVLVLSGPNAGGKTVAIKALGLAVVLAHCGIPVPATEALLPVLFQLRADIGDHQSIDADLSTFSAHLRAVRGWLEGIRRPALFLFDEIGTGTEPSEGAALAQAIMERLRDLGVHVVATTHQAPLKSWAMTARGVTSAAMEFDAATLQPTFRVLPSSAGTSAGIEVAARLGLSSELVARAREILGPEGRDAEALLSRLRELTADLERRQEEISLREHQWESERAREHDAIREEKHRLVVRMEKALADMVREFRAQAGKEIASIQDRKQRARLEKASVRAESRLRSVGRRARVTFPEDPAPRPARDEGSVPRPGDRVHVVSLDRDGVVTAAMGDRLHVSFGHLGLTVRASDVTPAETNARLHGPEPWKVVSQEPAEPGDAPSGDPVELLLLGRRVDEAITEVDRFLDRASRQGLREVRVVHGHGTGRLRSAVRAHLREHPAVASIRPGGPGEGGDGATVVSLR